MSELRYDPLSERWTLVSPERLKRPRSTERDEACPFCVGNEAKTTREILRIPRIPGMGYWQVRVFANKFNVLEVESQLNRIEVGVYLRENGVGCHEVLVDHPYADHRHPAELEVEELALDFTAAKLRMHDLVRDRRMIYPVYFKNHGVTAGASIGHPHSQLVVLPIVPHEIRIALEVCRKHFDERKCCLICRIIDDEVRAGERIVILDERFVAWVPYAAPFAYEIMIAPRFHHHRFEWLTDDDIRDFAKSFSSALWRMRRVTNDADFNLVLYTAPWFENDVRPSRGATIAEDFHWYFRIMPRTARLAGFELGTGYYITEVAPEEAVRAYKECI